MTIGHKSYLVHAFFGDESNIWMIPPFALKVTINVQGMKNNAY